MTVEGMTALFVAGALMTFAAALGAAWAGIMSEILPWAFESGRDLAS
jgi:hypothetical protein